MRVPWDIHWSWAHQGPEDYSAFTAMQPGAFWILNPDAEIVRLAHVAAPNALIGLRDQPQGEEFDAVTADPIGTARRHMADHVAHIAKWASNIPPAQVFVTDINEMLMDTQAREQTVCAFYTELVNLGTERKVAVAAGAFGNGWPGNNDTEILHDTAVRWDQPHFKALLEAIRTGRKVGVNHFLNLHEYFGNTPQEIFGWQSGRFLHLLEWFKVWGWNPTDVPIRFGEFGFDRLAIDPGVADPGKRGWASWMPGNIYVSHLSWLLQQYSYYPSVLGAACFGWDSASTEWNGFNIRPISSLVVPMVQRMRNLPSPSVAQVPLSAKVIFPGGTVTTPVIPPVVVSPTDRLVALLKTAFGAAFVDLRASLPRNKNVPWFGKRDLAAVTEIVVHHTAGSGTLTWATVAQYEMSAHPTWPGIAYSIGVSPAGMVSLLADIDEKRGATGNSLVNAIAYQVCTGGNFENDTPTAAMLAALQKLFATLSTFADKALKAIGHRDVPGDQTACPGAHLYAALFAPSVPPTGGPSAAALLAAGDKYRLLKHNLGAGLEKVIDRDGFSITSNEFPLLLGGVSYMCQQAEDPHSGTTRVYFAVVGNWANVKFVEK